MNSFLKKLGHGLHVAEKDTVKVAVPVARIAIPIAETVLPIALGPMGSLAASGLTMLDGGHELNKQNWMQFLFRALAAAPIIVAGIEQIHGDTMKGADKKTLAMESLGLASAIAPAIDPAHADVIAAATQLASQTIDGIVATMNAANGKHAAPVVAAPVAANSVAPIV